MNVVSNTSPLIFLAKIERLALLPALYDRVLIPSAVIEELYAKAVSERWLIDKYIQKKPFSIHKVEPSYLQRVKIHKLDKGEHAAIALALQENSNLVLLDDKHGRTVATRLHLSVTGTIGILLEAKLQGLISDIVPEVKQLKAAGMWLSPKFYQRILGSS